MGASTTSAALKNVSHIFSASVASTSSGSRQAAKRILATCTGILVMARAMTKRIFVQGSGTVTIAKAITRTISALIHGTVAVFGGRVHPLALAITVSSLSGISTVYDNLLRRIKKTISVVFLGRTKTTSQTGRVETTISVE
jgi:hypothetical protein